MRKTTLAVAVLSHSLAPLFVAALSPLVTREPFRARTLVATGVGLLGLALLLEPWRSPGPSVLLGAAAGAGSAVFYAGNVLTQKRIGGAISPSEILAYHAPPACVLLYLALPDAALASPTLTLAAPDPRPRPTVLVQDVDLVAGRHTLTLAPPEVTPGPFRFAAVADLQTGLPIVDQVFRAIATTAPRFVVVMGDLTDRGELAEYDLLATQLATLPVPFYPTLGNHELWADDERYRVRYGRSSFQFMFRDVAFTFVDSGDAGLDPLVEDELDGWLAAAQDQVHVFLTHIPPIEPVGVRYGSFRSRRDGQRLIAKLAAAGVDLALYGHIHTYLAYDHAGIPAFISGGGGAQPERWDGIGRHFLVVDIAPTGTPTVGVHRVD